MGEIREMPQGAVRAGLLHNPVSRQSPCRVPYSVCLGLAAAAIAYGSPVLASLPTPLRSWFGVCDHLEEQHQVALTFDDGPHPVATPAVLQVLDDLNVRATFFLVGERVEQMPALVREIVAAGHGIGVHGYRHRPQALLWPHHVYEDIYRGLAVVGEVTGLYPRHYRPPYGIVTGVGLRAVRRLGGETWLWTADGRDWRPRATAQGIAGRVLRQTRGGGVILLHDSDVYGSTGSWRQVLGALPTVVRGLRARGLHIRPLCDKQVICLS